MTGVSFIVTVYNKRPYLPGVLEALQAQIGDFTREYVFVDDGSTDESLAFLQRATATWPNCKIIAQANRGASAAQNAAVAAATQPYLKLLDADDLLVPDATRWLLEALRRTGAVLAYGRGGFYDSGQPVEWPIGPAEPALELIANPLRQSMRGALFNPSMMLLARAHYLAAGGADELVCCQDYSLDLSLARLGPFVRVDAIVMLAPSVAPGRISDNHVRLLHDVNRTLGNFIKRNPDLPARDKAYAAARAAGRAMLWSRRHGNFRGAIRFALLQALARLNLIRNYADAILRCCEAFAYEPPVPIAKGEAQAGRAHPGTPGT